LKIRNLFKKKSQGRREEDELGEARSENHEQELLGLLAKG
jgi:hypothetical protein